MVTGQLDEIVNTDDFVSFRPASSGTVTVTLDCFDNGLNNVDFDIVAASNCTASPNIVGQALTVNPVEQFTFSGNAGTTYYVNIEAFLGSGAYRLTVQTP
jgi:hypothetical protein